MLNRVILMGRLTAAPELKTTTSNVPVCAFRLAVERSYTPKGQEKQTDFISVVAWRSTAEFVSKYFDKGQLVALEGSLQTRGYTDNAGNRRTATEVIADQVYFAEPKRPQQKHAEAVIPDLSDFEEVNTDSENLPF